jgi:hypothetical protein
MVSASAAAIKWLEQLLAQEKELDSREGAITTWEDGLVAFACALGDARMECDAKRVQAVAVQQYFLAGRVPLVPALNSSTILAGRWSNARSSFAYRRQTWRCRRRYW